LAGARRYARNGGGHADFSPGHESFSPIPLCAETGK